MKSAESHLTKPSKNSMSSFLIKNSCRALQAAILSLIFIAGSATRLFAQTTHTATERPSLFDNPFVITLIVVMIILLIIIALLANVVSGAAYYLRQKEKESETTTQNKLVNANPLVTTAVFLLLSLAANAQGAVPTTMNNRLGGLSATTYYVFISVLGFELLTIACLLYFLRTLIQRKVSVSQPVLKPVLWRSRFTLLWDKLNKFKPVSQERDILLDHEYDGIRELDNKLPPWWLYGFYLSILFAGIYLYRYHVAHSAPLSAGELEIAMKEAEISHQKYLKTAANLVDENSITIVTDPRAIGEGKKLFEMNCSPCHGKSGEGTVGPNLTDEYWLHGGSIKDIFKTIKYGWPEKGMKSWKDDFSPGQIASLSGFILTLRGSTPPNAKEKQGELYVVTQAQASPSIDSVATGNRQKVAILDK
jgi:cytochrome c oxidase cbb3-type subunit III